MDRHAEWIKAQHELSEASKGVHYWDAMPRDLRTRLGAAQYREKRAEARHRLKRADRLCRDASMTSRVAIRSEARG